jgi:hypothetical protein
VITGDNCSLISRAQAQDGRRDGLRSSNVRSPTQFGRPGDAARLKAREIIDQSPQSGYLPIVENWRQLPDGQIAFTNRRLPVAD